MGPSSLGSGVVVGRVNWFQKPVGGIRDALVHLVHGGLYSYVPDAGTPHSATPPETNDASAALASPTARDPAPAATGSQQLRHAALTAR